MQTEKAMKPILKDGKIIVDYLTFLHISTTPENECFICDELVRHFEVEKLPEHNKPKALSREELKEITEKALSEARQKTSHYIV